MWLTRQAVWRQFNLFGEMREEDKKIQQVETVAPSQQEQSPTQPGTVESVAPVVPAATAVRPQGTQDNTVTTFDRITKPRLISKPELQYDKSIPKPAEIIEKQELINARPDKTIDGLTYKANTGKLYDEQGREMSPFAFAKHVAEKGQMTPEEKAAEAKRERRSKIFSAIGDGISALANVYFASKGAPDMYDPKTSMSAKTKEYWDKLNAERKADADKYNNLLLSAYKADKADKDAKDKWQQQLEQWKIEMGRKNEAEMYKRGKDAADAKYRKEKDDANRSSREKIAASQIAAADKRAAADRSQKQVQFNKKMQAMYGGSGGGTKGKYTFSLGRGKGQISVNSDAVNDANVKQIWDRLPDDVKQQAQEYYKTAKTDNGFTVYARDEKGNIMTDENGNMIPVYKPLTKNEMLEVIGANLEGNPDLQNDIRELAGQQVSEEDFSQYLDKGNGSKETKDFSIYKTDKKK